MATVAGQLTTFNMPNFVGPMAALTPQDTPLTTTVWGKLQAQRQVEIPWTEYTGETASQDTKPEGIDAVFGGITRDPFANVLQIHQEGVEVSYTKLAAIAQLGAPAAALSGAHVLGDQVVTREDVFQVMEKLKKIKRDLEFSAIQGTYSYTTTNAVARRTRGILEHVTTNVVALSLAPDVTPADIETVVQSMVDNGASVEDVYLHMNSHNLRVLNAAYQALGDEPRSRTEKGVMVRTVYTAFGPVNFVYNRYAPADEIAFVDHAEVIPKALEIPGKGVLFTEPLAKTGSAERQQIYGEFGFHWGPEVRHGKITGTSVS